MHFHSTVQFVRNIEIATKRLSFRILRSRQITGNTNLFAVVVAEARCAAFAH